MDDQHLATSHKIDPKKGNCLQVIHMHIKRLNNFLDWSRWGSSREQGNATSVLHQPHSSQPKSSAQLLTYPRCRPKQLPEKPLGLSADSKPKRFFHTLLTQS